MDVQDLIRDKAKAAGLLEQTAGCRRTSDEARIESDEENGPDLDPLTLHRASNSRSSGVTCARL